MIFFFLPSFALLPSQDWAFQLGLSLVIFVVLNSLVWRPVPTATLSAPRSQPDVIDPEEDYLPRSLQKQGPTPAEMEASYRWGVAELQLHEWQSLLSDAERRWPA